MCICYFLTQGTSAILMENKDMYMLNPCSNKIWYVAPRYQLCSILCRCIYFLNSFSLLHRFIIELCEPIQVKQLDIANFELFSSMPKDFLVSISDRYALKPEMLMQPSHRFPSSSVRNRDVTVWDFTVRYGDGVSTVYHGIPQ